MLKILEINSLKEELRIYWKRFAASVTDFANRYRADQFLRTEITIVALQIGFALILLGVVWIGFSAVHQDVTNALVAQLVEISQKGAGAFQNGAATEIVRNVQEVQAKSLIAIVASIILTTALFGYALARLAMIPTRNALSAQKQFIGNVAHELRTPLSIIKTNTEVALFDPNVHREVREMLTSTVEELDRISHIIDNLLSISAFVRPERIEFSNVDLGDVVDTAIAEIAPLAKKKNQTIDLKKAEFRSVWGNATALMQVAMNLIKNAVNYSATGSSIAVSVEPDYHGNIIFSVKDNGAGIAQKDLFRIFEPFYRGEASRSREKGSSGLGLTIVSELVRLHHGKISIQSAVRRGTTVTVTLPCGKNSENEASIAREGQKNLGEIAVDYST
jgi:signal transduction histidine kinase